MLYDDLMTNIVQDRNTIQGLIDNFPLNMRQEIEFERIRLNYINYSLRRRQGFPAGFDMDDSNVN